MKCPNCEVENDENAMYCYYCGRVLPSVVWNINADSKEENKKNKSNLILKIMLGVLGGLLAASLAFLAVMVLKDTKKETSDPTDLKERADSRYEAEDYMSAAVIYDQILEEEPDSDEAMYGSVMSKIFFAAEELRCYVKDEEYTDATEYIDEYNIDDYIEQAKETGIEFPLICDTKYGKVGFYLFGENEFYTYVGEYENDLRSGQGCIIASSVSDFAHGSYACYVAIGQWKDDVPNGYMEVIEDSTTCKYIDMKGTVQNGLWVGEVTLEGIGYDGECQFRLICEYEEGIAQKEEELKTKDGIIYRISKDNEEYNVFMVLPADAIEMTCGIISFADLL